MALEREETVNRSRNIAMAWMLPTTGLLIRFCVWSSQAQVPSRLILSSIPLPRGLFGSRLSILTST